MIRWLDQSQHNNPSPAAIRAARRLFSRGMARFSIGSDLDTRYWAHRAAYLDAGYEFGSYHALRETNGMVAQARKFVRGRPQGQLRDWIDAERNGLTGAMVDLFLDEYEQETGGTNADFYTGFPFMQRILPQLRDPARLLDYGLIIAAYPFDTPAGKPPPMDAASVLRRSTPPLGSPPPIPPPWNSLPVGQQFVAHQHTGQGSIDDYAGFLDMSYSLIDRPDPDPAPSPDPVSIWLAEIDEFVDDIRQEIN